MLVLDQDCQIATFVPLGILLSYFAPPPSPPASVHELVL